MIKLYNTLTKRKEDFKAIEEDKKLVKVYSCGPTIYNFVTIGNLRAYIFNDILIKTLEYLKYDVLSVMNLTDVDDKTIRDSKKIKTDSKKPNDILLEFTQIYEKHFYDDLNSLHIKMPKIIPKATQSITDMEYIIQELYKKGYAYVAEDGIYFDLSKYDKYGQLVEIDFDSQKYNKENRMIKDEYDKDNVQDFVLWKLKDDEDEPSWTIKVDNKEYEGRPGWHIECSAMGYKTLGSNIDIHTGGIDLKFPHHENEIAQNTASCTIKKVNFWMHNDHLLVDGKKMSKSLNNFYTLRDLIAKDYNPLALRELCLRTHYRKPLNFTFDSLDVAQKNIKKINEFYSRLHIIQPNTKDNNLKKEYDKNIKAFEEAISDDLNTPLALSFIYEFMNEFNQYKEHSKGDIKLALDFMHKTDSILSLLMPEDEIPLEVLELAKERKSSRDSKNFEKSDILRDEIKKLGFDIKDDNVAKEGFILSKSE